MSIKLKYILLLTSLPATLLAQEPLTHEEISSGGDYFSGSNVSLAWTLGPGCTETLSAENFVLTQGFNQSSYLITSVDEHQLTDNTQNTSNIEVFPNPVSNYVEIRFTEAPEDHSQWTASIIDMHGKTIIHCKNLKTKHAETHRIDLNTLTNNTYILTIHATHKNKPIQKTFKLVKQ